MRKLTEFIKYAIPALVILLYFTMRLNSANKTISDLQEEIIDTRKESERHKNNVIEYSEKYEKIFALLKNCESKSED